MSSHESNEETEANSDDPRAVTLRVRAATVEVTRGPDKGRTARVVEPTFAIGTGEGVDLRLRDSTVSREHLRILLLPSGVRLVDRGSKNGTWIGSVRVDQVTLTADATLEVGASSLLVRLDAAALDLPMSASVTFGGAIGGAPTMRHLFALLERAARSDVTVLLEGESGVGKDVLARAIHGQSVRKDGPFVAVDCGAIPANLIESELFGHERGAFTGAVQRREGLFEQAEGGTLFLDEIGELPLDMQPKLLRVLEERVVRPVGGKGTRPANVRVIAATNRKLNEAVQNDEFRRDLFYRLAVARATVPPLRDRPDDILPLANEFLRRVVGDSNATLPPDLIALLTTYSWPGNVRELRNVIERYALLGMRDAHALFDQSPSRTSESDFSHLEYHEARRAAIDQFERAYFPRVLERAGGVVSRAAELAGVARASFYRMLERVRVPVDDE